MKIALVYVCVLGKAEPSAAAPELYWPYAERFARTYQEFPPGMDHELYVVGTNPPDVAAEARMVELFSDIPSEHFIYTGSGYDIGAEQFVARWLKEDFAVFMGAQIHFKRPGWLKPLANARWRYGEGLYGPFASYEIQPHIRSTCYACDPHLLAEFSHTITTKEQGHYFESGAWNFSTRMLESGRDALLVTWGGVYGPGCWRTPPNIFRRGDQSNCLLWDHHCEIYANASPEQKAELEKMANGK